MKQLLQSITVFILVVIFLMTLNLPVVAQTSEHKPFAEDPVKDSFDIRNNAFILPGRHPSKKYTQQLSIIYVVLPRDWTLDVINAPMFSYAGKYALPEGFNIQASISTLVISYRTLLGPFWNYTVNDHFHFAAGWQVGFNFGVLNQFGFRTKLVIWEQQPSVLAGYSFKKMAVTLKGEMIWTNAIYESQGGHVVPYENSFINGYGISGSIEQRLYKNKILSFTVKFSDLRYHIIAWPAFPVNQQRYWVPEFTVGLKL